MKKKCTEVTMLLLFVFCLFVLVKKVKLFIETPTNSMICIPIPNSIIRKIDLALEDTFNLSLSYP